MPSVQAARRRVNEKPAGIDPDICSAIAILCLSIPAQWQGNQLSCRQCSAIDGFEGWIGKAQAGELRHQCFQTGAQDEPGQAVADAEMNSTAENGHTLRIAIDIEPHRIGILAWIP